MEFLFEFGLFAGKFIFGAVCIVIALVCVLMAVKAAKGEMDEKKEKLKFTDLMVEAEERKDSIEDAVLRFDANKDEKTLKKELKLKSKNRNKSEEAHKKERAEKIKKAKDEGRFCPKRIFVLDFEGDTHASASHDLRLKVNAILDIATAEDEVIVNLDSPGGVVNGYGFCSSILERIRKRGIHLTVCVDNVAASGGYLMSCVADKIVAAPFAYVGSIGVVANIPNFNKVLKKHDVDYEQVTAGKYKRTLTMFGENTEEGRAKFKAEMEAIHFRFKEIVSKYRPKLNIEEIATGEFWLGKDALERGLVDELNTFDAYLQNSLEFTQDCAIKISIERKEKKSLKDLLGKFFSAKTWTRAVKEEVAQSVNNATPYR